MPARGRKPDLRVVQGGKAVCGYPTAKGTPCSRAASGLCWQHDAEPEPTSEKYPPPGHLGDDGSWFWRKYLPLLIEKGVAQTLDIPAFTTLCELYESKMRCWREWQDGAVSYTTDRGPKKNPSWTQYQQAEREFRLMLESFGLTPTTRQKLGLEDRGQKRGVDKIRQMG